MTRPDILDISSRQSSTDINLQANYSLAMRHSGGHFSGNLHWRQAIGLISVDRAGIHLVSIGYPDLPGTYTDLLSPGLVSRLFAVVPIFCADLFNKVLFELTCFACSPGLKFSGLEASISPLSLPLQPRAFTLLLCRLP